MILHSRAILRESGVINIALLSIEREQVDGDVAAVKIKSKNVGDLLEESVMKVGERAFNHCFDSALLWQIKPLLNSI